MTVNVAIDVAVHARVEPGGDTYSVLQGEHRIEAASPAELAATPEGALVGLVAGALELPPFAAVLASDSPRGGGLGASSALTVALIAAAEEAFDLPRSAASQRAALARDLEARLMGLPTGTQDHHAAQLGGALEIRHRPGGEEVRRIAADLEALAESLLVVYTGQSHFSAGQNWQVVRRRLDGEPEVTALLDGIAEVASDLAAALAAGDLLRVGANMSKEWSLRRRLATGISTEAIERLLDLAATAGAWGGKACGAGGGGSLAILCPPNRREDIAKTLAAAGGELLPARPVDQPLKVFQNPVP
jgi:D-glycero-alpha-D-manno-heptose-7-phosphate kinase